MTSKVWMDQKKRTITVCRGAGAKDIISTCESESGNIKIK